MPHTPAPDGPTADELPRVGVVGLGIMGSLYARHLAGAGYPTFGFDPEAAAMAALAAAGGQACASAAEVVDRADHVITALSSIAAFRMLMTGPDAITRRCRRGQVFIDTGTLPIADKQQARDILAARGAGMVDAPVTGTRMHAERKELVVYASGAPEDVQRVTPLLGAFAKDVRHVGVFGNGMRLKLVTNHLVAVHNAATAEALALAQAAGLDLQFVYDSIQGGPAASAVFNFRGPIMVRGRYDAPTMRMDVFQKDIHVIGEFASGLGMEMPLFESCRQLYRAADEMGYREEDVSAIFELLRKRPPAAGGVH